MPHNPPPLLISIPAWGEWHTQTCVHAALRSVRAALEHMAAATVRFLVHTDRRDFLKPAFRGLDVEFRAVPQHPNFYVTMGNCHREALAAARTGEAIVLMCADQVISGESLASTQRILSTAARAIFCVGPRAIGKPTDVPVGISGRDLLAWGLANRHPWSSELVWGRGRSRALSLVYFEGPESVVAHGYHLHPFAVLKDRDVTFKRATLDLDLIDCFSRDEIHVVTSPDTLSTIEISPLKKMVAIGPHPFDAAAVAGWAKNNTSPMHRWLFSHRLVLAGDGHGCGDGPVVADIERQLAAVDQRAMAAA